VEVGGLLLHQLVGIQGREGGDHGRDGVLIGSNVAIRDQDHGMAPNRHRARQTLVAEPVEIGDFVWLGQNVVVLKGVTIGKNAIVGANAVVTRSVVEGAIVAGVPARQIGWIDGRPFEG